MKATHPDLPQIKKINVPAVLDQLFIESIVAEYKLLLSYSEEQKKVSFQSLEFHFGVADNGTDEDFDLVFLSYLTLIKQDFPKLNIELYFSSKNGKGSNLYFKIVIHRIHLRIVTRSEIFGLYLDGKPEKLREASQSDSFWPPLLIRPDLVPDLFLPIKDGSFIRLLSAYFESDGAKRDSFVDFKRFYTNSIKESRASLNSEFLSGLYFIDSILQLPIAPSDLLHLAGIEAPEDKTIKQTNSSIILKVMREEEIYRFSQVEIYCFSTLLGTRKMFGVSSDSLEKTTKSGKNGFKAEDLIFSDNYKLAYENNFRSLIKSARAMAFGLYELAKNIIEHTESRTGIITARKYNLSRLKRLKRVSPSWIKQFSTEHKFLDINVIDTGRKGICSSYHHNLLTESAAIKGDSESDKLVAQIKKEYIDDIAEVVNYPLSSFFNFNSVKLFHQINRSKARLGLLIFSQTVLRDAKGFVKIASNDFDEELPLGYALFEENGAIVDQDMSDFYRLGTNYNFIVPLSSNFFIPETVKNSEGTDSGTPSSIFLEFQSFDLNLGDKEKSQLYHFSPSGDYTALGKYEKLDKLKTEALVVKPDQLLVLDYRKCAIILQSSSDWIRFLANIQFSSNGQKELIITYMPLDLYLEVTNILRIFNFSSGSAELGFWKQDCYILFFLPITHFQDRDITVGGRPKNTFWFNSLLCGLSYQHFINVNIDINHYHNNLLRLAEPLLEIHKPNPLKMSGKLFSSNGKLFNFELVLESDEGITFFEDTIRSLVDIEINDGLK